MLFVWIWRAIIKVFKDAFKTLRNRYMAILGFCFSVMGPLALIVNEMVVKKPKNWSINIWVVPVMIGLLIYYWISFRKKIRSKKAEEKIVMKLDSDKASPFLLLVTSTIDRLMTLATVYSMYYIVKNIEKMSINLSKFLLVFFYLMVAGAICYTLDTLMTIGRSAKNEKQ